MFVFVRFLYVDLVLINGYRTALLVRSLFLISEIMLNPNISICLSRRSSYFRNIEDDVQKHATSIMEVKSSLESFETKDMEKLLGFYERIEMLLEQLTDESQVTKEIFNM